MFDDSTKVVDTTQVKSAGKTLALVLALCVASYLPGRWIVEQTGHAIARAKLGVRSGFVEILTWELGHFDIGIDPKARKIVKADSLTPEELQTTLYKFMVRNQNLEWALAEAKEKTRTLDIVLDVDGILPNPIENN